MTPVQWAFDSLPQRVSSNAPNVNIVPREVTISTNPIGKLSADGIPITEGANFFDIYVSWLPPQQTINGSLQNSPWTIGYVVEIKKGLTGAWEMTQNTIETFATFSNMPKATYYARVKATFFSNTNPSDWAESFIIVDYTTYSLKLSAKINSFIALDF